MDSIEDTEFESLAARVMGGQATPEEVEAFRHAKASSSPRVQASQEIETAFRSVPLAAALVLDPPSPPPFPAHRQAYLQSIVRRTFRPPASPRPPFGLEWLRWFGLAGLSVALVLVTLSLTSSRRLVELGMYQTEVVRGQSNALVLTSNDRLRVHEFSSDVAFDDWLARPFATNEKARLWLDDAAGVIHVRIAPHWWTEGREWTRPLSNDESERRRQIQEVLAEINSD